MSKVDLLHPRPLDATLTVTRAAEVLGVHANTVRAWSDAGRLRYYRINPRGDRRYRMGDLQRFLAASDATVTLPPIEPFDERPTGSRRRGAVVALEDHQAMLDLVGQLSSISGSAIREALASPDAPLQAAVEAIRDAFSAGHVSAWRTEGARLAPIAVAGPPGQALVRLPSTYGVLGVALADPSSVVDADQGEHLSATSQPGREVACAIPGDAEPWGVLLLVWGRTDPPTESERELLRVAATSVGSIVRAAASAADVAHQLQRADALRRVTSDIGSRLDLDEILNRLADHVQVLFAADRVAAFLFEEDGTRRMAASRGLSRSWISAVTSVEGTTLGTTAISARRPMFSVHYRGRPARRQPPRRRRPGGLRHRLHRAPARRRQSRAARHPRRRTTTSHIPGPTTSSRRWARSRRRRPSRSRRPRNYAQLATWAAQLQSIQQLGARLSRLTHVKEIGEAIATELRQLIDYHNVRVYRLYGEELVPVAMQGRVGEYEDETLEQLKVEYGAGITGWVAKHRIAQLLDDASADERAETIPGTEDDLDESMLLAPMQFEDDCLGVLVLSKLGLRQFRDDDLRLLEIYASVAAQAMANADATERLREQSAALEQKVRGQRELLQITESILTTLDPEVLLGTIADRLGDLIGSDNISIELVDQVTGLLTPVVARGVDAEYYLQPWEVGESGIATWVLEHNERGPHRRRVQRRPDPPAADGTRPRQHRVRAPSRARRRDRRADARAPRRGARVQRRRVRAGAAVRRPGLDRAPERRGPPGRPPASPDRRPDGAAQPRHVRPAHGRADHAAEPFSLVMLDLDHFKPVNDSMGHQAGDRLLKQVAQAIVAASRDSDRVFRYGGDEFAVLLPRTAGDQVGTIAERVRAAVNGSCSTAWSGTARRGRSTRPPEPRLPGRRRAADEVLLAADRALFVAKRAGGGRVAAASEGHALAGEFTLQPPTPIDALASPAA